MIGRNTKERRGMERRRTIEYRLIVYYFFGQSSFFVPLVAWSVRHDIRIYICVCGMNDCQFTCT